MVNRELQTYDKFKLCGYDAYGQLTEMEQDGTITMTFGLFNNKNLTNPKFQEVTYYGLSIDKEVCDTSIIEVQGKKYKVMFVNPYGRLTEVFLSEY